jgi:mono/diheme cytochrome c family protein
MEHPYFENFRLMKFLVALLSVICCLWVLPANAQDQVARGRYLAILGDCTGCHSAAHKPAFSGGLPFTASFGIVYSTNITPDKETGIGAWSETQFYRALHQGIAPGGKHLYPAFPYIYFRRFDRQDTDALFRYLHTLKPVHQPPTPNKLIFPANLRFGLIFWNWLYFHKRPPAIPSGASDEWKRGEFLVNGPGHCAACHTPKNLLFGDEIDKPLSGGTVDNWYASNLTESMASGLGRWSHADVVKFLAAGRSPYATAAGSMLEKVTSSTSHMNNADREAIATYLKSLPPMDQTAFEAPRREEMERGRGLYLAHCQSCHAEDGRPSARDAKYPSLAGDTLVTGHDPTTVLRIILTGGFAPAEPGKPPIRPMPAFDKLDDGQIADMASYIRNAWSNKAPPVSATEVHALREALKD